MRLGDSCSPTSGAKNVPRCWAPLFVAFGKVRKIGCGPPAVGAILTNFHNPFSADFDMFTEKCAILSAVSDSRSWDRPNRFGERGTMLNPIKTLVQSAPAFLLVVLGATASQAQTQHPTPSVALDAGLFATYQTAQNDTILSLDVCGATGGSEGCYGGGSIGPLNRIGAVLEGAPETIGDTVSRDIYVLEVESGLNRNAVRLYIYKRQDVIADGFDEVSVAQISDLLLSPLVGGPQATSFMAGNGKFLAIGTDQSTDAVLVQKSTHSMASVGGFGINVSSITADDAGYITLTYGAGDDTGFIVLGPDGSFQEDGGGASFMVNTINGITFSNPNQDAQSRDNSEIRRQQRAVRRVTPIDAASEPK